MSSGWTHLYYLSFIFIYLFIYFYAHRRWLDVTPCSVPAPLCSDLLSRYSWQHPPGSSGWGAEGVGQRGELGHAALLPEPQEAGEDLETAV